MTRLDDPQWTTRRWNGAQAYSDSKLYDVMLAFAVARRWPTVFSNAMEPGWVATKMGGAGAPDDLSLAPVTQAWLAVSDDPAAKVTGQYFYHQKPRRVNPAAERTDLQERLLAYCAEVTGVTLPTLIFKRYPGRPTYHDGDSHDQTSGLRWHVDIGGLGSDDHPRPCRATDSDRIRARRLRRRRPRPCHRERAPADFQTRRQSRPGHASITFAGAGTMRGSVQCQGGVADGPYYGTGNSITIKVSGECDISAGANTMAEPWTGNFTLAVLVYTPKP